MFTGIIETVGTVEKIETVQSNYVFYIRSAISSSLHINESVSHNGVCLSVEHVFENVHSVTAVQETLQKTNLRNIQKNDKINLERSLSLHKKLDGHIVQGHIDTTAICLSKENKQGSWLFQFEYPTQFADLLIEKGSIAVNGASLTAFNVTNNKFSIAIIPYTYEHTNFCDIKPGIAANLEFDMIGKYIQRFLEVRQRKLYKN
jgi:riboflavin synthase